MYTVNAYTHANSTPNISIQPTTMQPTPDIHKGCPPRNPILGLILASLLAHELMA